MIAVIKAIMLVETIVARKQYIEITIIVTTIIEKNHNLNYHNLVVRIAINTGFFGWTDAPQLQAVSRNVTFQTLQFEPGTTRCRGLVRHKGTYTYIYIYIHMYIYTYVCVYIYIYEV